MAEQKLPPEQSAAADAVERRRPGRREYNNPSLIALLRRSEKNAQPKADTLADDRGSDAGDNERDDLAPARGILLSAAIGAVIVGAIALLLAVFGVL